MYPCSLPFLVFSAFLCADQDFQMVSFSCCLEDFFNISCGTGLVNDQFIQLLEV